MKGLNKYFTFFLIFFASYSFATHNRAGEITYEQIGPLTIRMTLTTYTKTSSASADRDSVEISWGDGSKQFVRRVNGNGVALPNDVKVNKYVAEHTYPGRTTYTISFSDPNRVGNILNINYPNSIDVPFSLTTTFTLLDFQFQGQNSSAQLLQPPLDFACVGKRFIHNPNAFDADGDSIAYELAIPFSEFGVLVPGYEFPDRILPGPNNSISLNQRTGDFVWNAPPQQGEYNIAIKIKEYRNGILINSIIRDMQILVRACDNDPPKIDVIEEICIVAGDTLDLEILVSDSDIRQNVSLSASGGPFEFQNGKAILQNSNIFLPTPFSGRLIWATNCDHISNQYYQIVFRAVDNFFADSTGLADLKTLRIKVVGPAPENLNATSVSGGTRLTWDLPYKCEELNDGEFLGFAVFRKQNPQPIYPDTCNPGLENSIYQKIAILTSENDGMDYFYEDLTIESDITYCYRVEALFAKLTSTGNPFNVVESLPSNETCLQLKRDLPILTKVSVLETAPVNGRIHVRWQKPIPLDLDTVAFPGPYRFELYRGSAVSPFTLIPDASVISNTISEIIDTNYFDSNLNTLSNQYAYKLIFYHSGNQVFGESEPASSIFLTTSPSDNQVILNWTSTTPWTNLTYEIHKETSPGNFTPLGVTRNTTFTDMGLINGENYCYLIKGIGSYGLIGIEEPIENFSQFACGMPQDNVPPCSPTITVTNVCDDPRNLINQNFSNTIAWNDPNIGCPLYEQVKGYNIYYKSATTADYVLIDFKSEGGNRQYIHDVEEFGLAGCYYITAIDALDNESEPSNTVCVENCPLYELPNTFTPNGDNANDLFKPIRNFFITKIDLKVFNEWGNLVFETEDPLVNWAGTTSNGKEVQQGTYYYSCVLYNLDSEGNEIRQSKLLKGFIQVLK